MKAIESQALIVQVNWRLRHQAVRSHEEDRPGHAGPSSSRRSSLTPSSFGLQPWKFFSVVENTAKRQELLAPLPGAKSRLSRPPTLSSSLPSIRLSYADDVRPFIVLIAEVRGTTVEEHFFFFFFFFFGYGKGHLRIHQQTTPTRSTIANGELASSITALGGKMRIHDLPPPCSESTPAPMEGPNPAAFPDKRLGLEGSGYSLVLAACAAGYRHDDDLNSPHFPKVRC